MSRPASRLRSCYTPDTPQCLRVSRPGFLEDVVLRPALPEKAKDEVDRKLRPFDHGLASQDIRVDSDPVLLRDTGEVIPAQIERL